MDYAQSFKTRIYSLQHEHIAYTTTTEFCSSEVNIELSMYILKSLHIKIIKRYDRSGRYVKERKILIDT